MMLKICDYASLEILRHRGHFVMQSIYLDGIVNRRTWQSKDAKALGKRFSQAAKRAEGPGLSDSRRTRGWNSCTITKTFLPASCLDHLLLNAPRVGWARKPNSPGFLTCQTRSQKDPQSSSPLGAWQSTLCRLKHCRRLCFSPKPAFRIESVAVYLMFTSYLPPSSKSDDLTLRRDRDEHRSFVVSKIVYIWLQVEAPGVLSRSHCRRPEHLSTSTLTTAW